ncbi:MAG: TonB-dependent receptor [Bacteroidetes bacterium]|nr:TonB-dependent receptor [Bacteroidota bacterium]
MKRVLLFFILLTLATCFSQEVQSQTVMLTVIDSATGLKLPDARVLCNPSPVSLIVNSDSVFKINLNGESSLTVSHLGYHSIQLKSDSGLDRVTILLKPMDVALEEIKIESERISGESIGKLTAEQLSRGFSFGGERDPLRLIANLPSFSPSNEAQGMLYFRGSYPYQSNYYLNGLRIPNPWHSGGFLSSIPGDFLESVDLFGSTQPGWSAPVTGAVISMKTSQKTPKNWETTLGTGLISNQVSVSGPLGNSGYIKTSYRRTFADWIMKAIFSDAKDPVPLYNFEDLLLTTGNDFQNGWKVHVTGILMGDHLGWTKSKTDISSSKLPNQDYEFSGRGGILTLIKELKSGISFDLSAFAFFESMKSNNSLKEIIESSEFNSIGFVFKIKKLTFGNLVLNQGLSAKSEKRKTNTNWVIDPGFGSRIMDWNGYITGNYFVNYQISLDGTIVISGLYINKTDKISNSGFETYRLFYPESMSTIYYPLANFKKYTNKLQFPHFSGSFSLNWIPNTLNRVTFTGFRKIQYQNDLMSANNVQTGLFNLEPTINETEIPKVTGVELNWELYLSEIWHFSSALFYSHSKNLTYQGLSIILNEYGVKKNFETGKFQNFSSTTESMIRGEFSEAKMGGVELGFWRKGKTSELSGYLSFRRSIHKLPVEIETPSLKRTEKWNHSPGSPDFSAELSWYQDVDENWNVNLKGFFREGTSFSYLELINEKRILLSWEHRFPPTFRVDAGLSRKFESESGQWRAELMIYIYNLLSRENPSVNVEYFKKESSEREYQFPRVKIKRKQYSLLPIVPTVGFRLWF